MARGIPANFQARKLLPARFVCQSGGHLSPRGFGMRGAHKPAAALIMTAQRRLTTSSSPRAFMKQYTCIYSTAATPLCLRPVSPARCDAMRPSRRRAVPGYFAHARGILPFLPRLCIRSCPLRDRYHCTIIVRHCQ